MKDKNKLGLVINLLFYCFILYTSISNIKILLFDEISLENTVSFTFLEVFAYFSSVLYCTFSSLFYIIFQKSIPNKIIVFYSLLSVIFLLLSVFVTIPIKSDLFLNALPKLGEHDLLRKKTIIELSVLVIFNLFNSFNSIIVYCKTKDLIKNTYLNN